MRNFNKPREKVCFSGSNYAREPVSWRSIKSFILNALDVPVSWQSKLQKSVSLSSSETEFVALSEAVEEVILVIQLLESMKTCVM